MKLKLTVLTLLVVGLAFGFSSVAFGAAAGVLELYTQDNTTYQVDSPAAADVEAIPALKFKIINTGDTDETVTAIVVTNGAGEATGTDGDLILNIYADADSNGVIDEGDTWLNAAATPGVNMESDAAGKTTLTLDAGLDIDALQTAHLIITVSTVVANTADLDAAELVLVLADALTGYSVVPTASTTAGLDPTAVGNVPIIKVDNAAGTVTPVAHPAASGGVMPVAGTMPNKAAEHVIAGFGLTADGTVSHVVNTFAIANTAAGGAAVGDFDTIKIYIDSDNSGTVTTGDIELDVSDATNQLDNANDAYTLDVPMFLAAGATKNIIVTTEGLGTAETGETLTSIVDTGAGVIDGGAAMQAGAPGGGAQTIAALDVTLETVDVAGPPYGRPNGYLDAIKVTFKVGTTATNILDSLLLDAEWDVKAPAAAYDHSETFTATYNSDVVNNSVAYFVIDENLNSLTEDLPTVDYTQGGTKITDTATGEYAVATFAGAGAADKAPPAPLSVKTNDADFDGKIDQLVIYFSEALSATSFAGFSVTGYTVAGSVALANGTVAPFNTGNEVLAITLTEGKTFDTNATPAYTYSDVAGVLKGAVGNNDVLSFNSLSVPTVDNVAPHLMKAKTLDEDADGKFDMLELTFSEPVQLDPDQPDLTAADITDNDGAAGKGIDFGASHTGTYNFTDTGNTGLGTAVLKLPVNEVGSLDTAVQPGLTYTATILTDMASSPLDLATAAPFTMVTSASLVNAVGKVYLADGISPQIVAAVTLDGSAQGAQNGKLDAVQLTFSEAMGTDVSTYSDLMISGVEVEADSAVVTGVNVLVGIKEDAYNTGLEPTISYSDTTIEDASGAKLSSFVPFVASDNAVPMVVKAVTKDMGYAAQTANNGKIDGMAVMFSEAMNIDKLDVRQSPDTADEELENEFFVTGYTVADTVEIVDASNFIIYLTEIGGATLDTEIKPNVTYTAAGDSSLADMAGYALDPITVTETDGAAPIVTQALTLDDNEDGFIDAVAITFHETPVIDEEDTAKVLAGVTMEEIDNVIDLSAATLSKSGSTLTMKGTSSKEFEKWDTGLLPKLIIGDDVGITDAAGNVVAATPDSVASTDGANPILAKSIAQKLTKNIVVTFSEPVLDAGGNPLDVGDLAYMNLAGDSTGTNDIDDITDNGDSDSTTWKVVTDSTLTDAMVAADNIRVVSGKIVDTLAGLAAIVDSLLISDIEVPTLVKASTMDANNDGYIDNIKLQFSEEVKDSNLSGYTAALDSVIAVPEADLWTVGGYTVLGINMTTSDAAAALATAEVGEDVFNVGDVNNDEYIYLALKQEIGVDTTGDTAAAPMLTMVGDDAAGSGVGDYAPNYVATIAADDSQYVSDKVGPVIMSATMPNQTTLEVTISEEAKTPLPTASSTFVWEVGTERIDYVAANYIVNMKQLTPGILTLQMRAGTDVPIETTSEIWYAAADKIKDLSKNGNAAMTDSTAVPEPIPDDDVAVASDLPDAFALSENFPNPFNPTTAINYAIPADGAGHVELAIYNVTGQKVRTLVSETQEAGYYNVVWDGRNDAGQLVSSGMYLYKIVSGNFTKSAKMTFMK